MQIRDNRMKRGTEHIGMEWCRTMCREEEGVHKERTENEQNW